MRDNDKQLIAERKDNGEIPEFIHTSRVENEVDSVIQIIQKLSKKYDYKDFAILVRANNHGEPFVRALTQSGIPCQFFGS